MKLSLYIIPEHFHHCKKFSVSISCDCLFLTPRPWQLLIYICLWICLFWTFHVNGVIWYVAFFVCSPTVPKVTSSKYILVVACIGTVSFVAEYCHCIDIMYFFCLSIWLWIVVLFLLFAYYEYNYEYFVYTLNFHFSYVL